MRKIILGIIVVLGLVFSFFTYGQQEVLSGYITNGEVNTPGTLEEKVEEVIEPSPPELPVVLEPEKTEEEVKEVKEEMTYDEVLQFIADNNKKTVSNPDDLLVLVNKENNLLSTYEPKDLIIPDIPFSFEGDYPKKYLRKDAALALEKLIYTAEEKGYKIYGISGYRSYDRQKNIFLANVRKYGFKKTNTFSAVPGQSEHQTGLVMDVSSASVGYKLVTSFAETPEGLWLKENAHLFGFIIRYPQEKVEITGYQYEPWHIRYVGIDAARKITKANLTLEEYLQSK